jgi:DNA-directed RNA polymerase delta subunit
VKGEGKHQKTRKGFEMAKISKNVVDKQLREAVFEAIFTNEIQNFVKVNDRQYGVLLTDLNCVQRYVRIGAIVAEEREDMTAEELMQKEIDTYNAKQAEKEAKAQARSEKAKKDKERREKEKEEVSES